MIATNAGRMVRIPIAALVGFLLALLLFATVGVGQAQATSNAYKLQSTFPGGKCDGLHNSGQRDGLGNVYVPCGNPSTVRVFDAKGTLTKTIPLGFYAADVAPSWDGNILYAAQFRPESAPEKGDGVAIAIRRLVKDAGTGNFAINEAGWSLKSYTKGGGTYKAKGAKIATDSKGHLYVSDGAGGNTDVQGDELSTIVKHDAAGNVVAHFGGNFKNGASEPFHGLLGGIAVSDDGNRVYAVEGNNPAGPVDNKGNHLFRFDKQTGSQAYAQKSRSGGDAVVGKECVYHGELGEAYTARAVNYYAAPWDVELDADENVYMVSASCREVLKFDSDFNFRVGMKIGNPTDEPFNQGKPHGIAVSAAGEVYIGQANAKMYLTAEAVRPTPTVAPASGAEGVGVGGNVTATFSEPMMPGVMNFVLKNAAGTEAASVVSYDKATKTATLNPNADLAAGATYTATLAGAKDHWGNLADPNPKTWTFKTAGGNVALPDTFITGGPQQDGTDEDTTPTFTFASNPTGAGFECKLDGALNFTVCATPYTTPTLVAGKHTLSVRAVNANGADASPAVRNWTVGTPPSGSCLGVATTRTNTDAAEDITDTAVTNDSVNARGGNDTIRNGSPGNGYDRLCGGAGGDTFKGTYVGISLLDGADKSAGLADNDPDTVSYAAVQGGDGSVWVDLDAPNPGGMPAGGYAEGPNFNHIIYGISDVEGGNYNDRLTGNNVSNSLYGFDGNDEIKGEGGKDYLSGMGGDDTMYSADGVADTVVCGDGAADKVVGDSLDVISNTAGCETVVRDTTAPTGGVLVNEGALYTRSPSVSLHLPTTDGNESGVESARFMNDGGVWTEWEPYRENRAWTLRNVQGQRTVSVQYRDAAGNISTSKSDAIALDSVAPSSGTISINGGNAYATSTLASLKLTATGATQVRFKNEAGIWSSSRAIGTTPHSWTLSAANGTRTVYAEFSDAAGNTLVRSDTIKLDTVKPTITSVVPSEGQQGVSKASNVIVNFSETMNASTVDMDSAGFYMRVQGATSNVAVSEFRWDTAKKRFVLDPRDYMLAGKIYEVRVTTNVKDLAGNTLATTKTWTFKVAG